MTTDPTPAAISPIGDEERAAFIAKEREVYEKYCAPQDGLVLALDARLTAVEARAEKEARQADAWSKAHAARAADLAAAEAERDALRAALDKISRCRGSDVRAEMGYMVALAIDALNGATTTAPSPKPADVGVTKEMVENAARAYDTEWQVWEGHDERACSRACMRRALHAALAAAHRGPVASGTPAASCVVSGEAGSDATQAAHRGEGEA